MEMKSTALTAPLSPFIPVLIAFGGWFFVALALGRLELLRGAPPPAVGGTVIIMVLLQLVAFRRWDAFRMWALSADLRLPVLVHLVRFVGVSFLVLHAQGRLPAGFALPAGWGDIAVAALAPVVALNLGSGGRSGRWTAGIWNLIGLADILMVVSTALRLGFDDPRIGATMTSLPHVLLPLFVVPILIASHLLIALRLYRGGTGESGRP